MEPNSLERANALLRVHALAAVRLAGWDPARNEARFEVVHIEWPSQVFGELRFTGVSYLQVPSRTTWGYQLRTRAEAELPSRGDVDSSETIYELFAPDGQEPSAYVVALGLECRPA